MIHVYRQEVDNIWYAAAMQNGQVFAASFSQKEKEVLRNLFESLPYTVPFQVTEKPNRLLTELLKTLKATFDGKNGDTSSFNLVMNHLSSHTRKVLNCTSMIPVGYLTTYGAIAKVVGGSPRSVGRAEASNPFPLLIPCHRVVHSNLAIGGYGLGGEEVKLQILRREDRGYEKTTSLKINDKTLPLFPIKNLRKD